MADISNGLIIFLSIFGAACFVVIGYATHRFFLGQNTTEDVDEFNQRNLEQDQYMAELREKYRDGIMTDLRSEGRPVQYNGPPV